MPKIILKDGEKCWMIVSTLNKDYVDDTDFIAMNSLHVIKSVSSGGDGEFRTKKEATAALKKILSILKNN